MTVKEINQIIDQLIKEDVNGNKDLINFYQKKVQEASQVGFEKGFKKAFK